jgi:hypothetical protein
MYPVFEVTYRGCASTFGESDQSQAGMASCPAISHNTPQEINADASACYEYIIGIFCPRNPKHFSFHLNVCLTFIFPRLQDA